MRQVSCRFQFLTVSPSTWTLYLILVLPFCFGINSNGSCFAVGKLYAFAGRNNALRRARIIFDGKALVDVGIEIGQRISDAPSRSCIEVGCTITRHIRRSTAFEHVIRR